MQKRILEIIIIALIKIIVSPIISFLLKLASVWILDYFVGDTILDAMTDLGDAVRNGISPFDARNNTRDLLYNLTFIALIPAGFSASVWIIFTEIKRPFKPSQINDVNIWWYAFFLGTGLATLLASLIVCIKEGMIVHGYLLLLVIFPTIVTLCVHWLLTLLFTRRAFRGQIPLANRIIRVERSA